MKVLIIEEEPGKARTYSSLLSQHDISYATAASVSQTESRSAPCHAVSISPSDYDLMMIDVCTPDKDGSDICRLLRQHNNPSPILLLSILGEPAQRVKGLDAGADDYLVKPCHPEELMARMNALTRFRRLATVHPIKKAGEVELDTYRRTVTLRGKRIDLTGREFALLDLLISHKNRVLPRAYISEAIWGISFDRRTNLVDVYIKYLRKKIDAEFSVRHIQTVVGRGYVFKEG